MKKLIILSTLILCSCSNENGELVAPFPEGNMAAAATTSDSSQPIKLSPSGTNSKLPPADSMNKAVAVKPAPRVINQRVILPNPPVPAPFPQDMRNNSSVYLSDSFDEALSKTGRPDFIQYQGNKAFVSYKAKDFTMYEGGECKITFEKRLVQKCEGCNLQRFPCSE